MKTAKELIEKFEEDSDTLSFGTITLTDLSVTPGAPIYNDVIVSDGDILVYDGNQWTCAPSPYGVSPIESARTIIHDALMDDDDLAGGYIANIAMLLHDHYNEADFTDKDVRESAAIDILDLLFGEN